jgi:cleavage and polyadenylation specificity factor subunit 5
MRMAQFAQLRGWINPMLPVQVHGLDSYDIHPKAAIPLKDPHPAARMKRAEAKFQVEGIRRVVEAVLLVHIKGHPHVLLLNTKQYFVLPGGKLKPGEDEVSGLKRKLNDKLGAVEGNSIEWEIGEVLANWWRIGNEPVFFPYLPVHSTKPKEVRKVFLVHLPEKCTFYHPENLELSAVPLMDLYNNAEGYGNILSAIPVLLSRLSVNAL